ncbi:MAG TPA: tetratricopeptide repeat protein [Candidatus Sulfotelmatobacter sp.]|jgi:tetratricopeptide (TPR) repeat protein/TolB-like protein|nr:tetratricopeptide repeat protein [Candidatus Sulfotelmatobacter sp.]
MEKRRHWYRKVSLILFGALVFLWPSAMSGRQGTAPAPGRISSLPQTGVFLVFPFENAGASPRLDWVGAGLEELTIQKLSAAGQQVYSHEGRLDEMDRAGLPPNAKLSRATMLHIAQDLDADYVVFGNFTSDGTSLTVNARVLRVNPVALLPAVRETGPLDSMMNLHVRVTWRLLTTIDHNFPLSLAEFSKLQRSIYLGAFEQYIRGLLAGEDDARIRDLKEAARLEPNWPDPAFSLGQVYFTRNDCASALPWFARVPPTNERSVEAIFATGVCYLRLNQPDKAEKVFSKLQEDLKLSMVSGADLPEILNNLGLALARQGKLGTAIPSLSRARDLDPDEDDYPFNLGLLALQNNDLAAATAQFREAMEREPDNAEDRAFLIYSMERAGKKEESAEARSTALEAFGPNGLPALKLDGKPESLAKYQRINRELDTTALRMQLATPVTPGNTAAESAAAIDPAVARIRRGRQELGAGRLDTAEKEFRAALAADPKNALAHRELADISRRKGKLDEAVQELQTSLALRDSATGRVMLARIYLEQKKPELARAEVEKAVKLAPNYAEARQLLEHLGKSKPTGGAQ